jgi:hypothetical protein
MPWRWRCGGSPSWSGRPEQSEVLEIARGKPWGAAQTRFRRHDAFEVAGISGRFDAGFAGFWWSHVGSN